MARKRPSADTEARYWVPGVGAGCGGFRRGAACPREANQAGGAVARASPFGVSSKPPGHSIIPCGADTKRHENRRSRTRKRAVPSVVQTPPPRLSCPPKAAFVPFRVCPAGKPNTSVFFSVRRRRLSVCSVAEDPRRARGRRGNDHRTHGGKGARCLVRGAWCGGFGAGRPTRAKRVRAGGAVARALPFGVSSRPSGRPGAWGAPVSLRNVRGGENVLYCTPTFQRKVRQHETG